MAVPLHPLLWTGVALAAAPVAFYAVFLALLVTPFIQRHALYAHKINTLLWSDVNRPEGWGFATNQVTPFTLDTPDGESVYAWHVLPLPLYLKHESSLVNQQPGLSPNFAETGSFRLLKEDPEARLNTGHIAQALRPDSYHALTDTSSYHVVAIDYRGFGHSTGVPSEKGLILDASTLVEWAVNVAGVPPSRIVLLGHSLGTAVVSGVAERYALKGVEFAGIVLVAGFGDLASMLSGYRIGGFVPLLGPFAAWPSFVRLLDRFIVDKWHSASRLTNIVRHTKMRLRLFMVHAKNDRDIPWTEDNKLFRAAANETAGGLDDGEFEAWKEQRTVHRGKDAFVATWRSDPDIMIQQELFPYGGHDPIMGYAPVALAIMRSFDHRGWNR
ncbi:Abhydrolase domain-containing protein 12B [Tolypocladium capitatum]|uniref:Abhydrolase domain-containing protein 12B n=1 Tax=Tolypocladium capitatum TaxID=45235 RepID=A0A2K3QQM9_9HYPO|nr:Abhydrolase domain-containing protein 12B [Tolypocladium capitatum]